MRISCSDPEVVSDLYHKENKNVDKTDEAALLFKEILGSSLLSSPSNEDWRRKRKALAHAFYKERLGLMTGVLKDTVCKRLSKWHQEILKNEGSTQIDISHEFETIFNDNIVHIAFGEDLSDLKFDFDFFNSEKQKFDRRQVNIGEALSNVFDQLVYMIVMRHENPITFLAFRLFSYNLDLHPNCKVIKSNC